MDNATRRQLLEQAKASNFQGDILDVFKAYDQGVNILEQPQQTQVFNTPKEQQQGLSNIPLSQAPQKAIFPNTSPRFNTKGMQFPIDVEFRDQKTNHLLQSFKNVPPGIKDFGVGPHRGELVAIETPSKQQSGGFKKFQNGGNTSTKQIRKANNLKKNLLKKYPAFKNVYGEQGENLNLIKDKNYKARDYGYGDIEFIFPGDGTVTYGDEYQYTSPTPDKYTVVYNKKAGKGDVYLDMLHGMRNDPEYMKLLNSFSSTVKNARGGDMDYFYNIDLQEGFAEDGKERWEENYIDAILRSELAGKGMGRRSKGRRDYRMERKGNSPDIQEASDRILNYLKQTKLQNGGIKTYKSLPKY